MLVYGTESANGKYGRISFRTGKERRKDFITEEKYQVYDPFCGDSKNFSFYYGTKNLKTFEITLPISIFTFSEREFD